MKPLIYDRVRSLRLDVPEEFLLSMERSYAGTFASNCEILSALDEMGRILSQHGIDVVPIKGASLIQRVYEDPGLRPLSDLDVWIDGDNAHLAQQILLDVGFAKKWKKFHAASLRNHMRLQHAPLSCKRLNAEIDKQIGRSHLHTHLAPLLLPRGSGIMLEIHPRLGWNISALSPKQARDIWNRRKPSAEKKGLALVSEKDEIVILAAHLLYHRKAYKQNLLQHVDIALAWKKEAWRSGIKNMDNQEVKELVDFSVAVLVPLDEMSSEPFQSRSSGDLFFGTIQPGFFKKNKNFLRRLPKIWKGYGFLKLVRYLWEGVFPSPADMRYLCGNQKESLFFCYFYRIFDRIWRV